MAGLTADQSKYYDDFDEMFATNGWKKLMEECKEEIYNRQASSLEAKTWDQVVENRGAAQMLNYLLSLETILDLQKEEAEEVAEEEGERGMLDASV